jgi:hypothetical protein
MDRDCINCKHSGMDMDMDPYCAHPLVLEKYSYGLVLRSLKIVEYCRSPEHPLFVVREVKKRNIYVASSWRNEQQPSVVKALRDAGFDVYDFKNPTADDKGFGWSEIDPNWKSWTARDQIACYRHPAAVRGLKNDFDAMKAADIFVMVQPCGRSAALELGWAIGAGKKTFVLMVDGQEPELMIRLADHLCLSIEEIIEKLKER